MRRIGHFFEGGDTSWLSLVAGFFAVMFGLSFIIGALQFVWMIFWHGVPGAISWAITDEYFLISLLVLTISALVVAIDILISAKLNRSMKTRQDIYFKESGRVNMAAALAEMSQNLDEKAKVKFYEVANKRLREREGPGFEDFTP